MGKTFEFTSILVFVFALLCLRWDFGRIGVRHRIRIGITFKLPALDCHLIKCRSPKALRRGGGLRSWVGRHVHRCRGRVGGAARKEHSWRHVTARQQEVPLNIQNWTVNIEATHQLTTNIQLTNDYDSHLGIEALPERTTYIK